jgi:hypothetical protein
MARQVLAVAALALAAVFGTAADASDYKGGRQDGAYKYVAPGILSYRPVTPSCADPFTLRSIHSRFQWAESRTFHSPAKIAAIDYIEETRLEPIGRSIIERRYCQAFATLNDGNRQRLYYLIESNQGFAAVGSRVQFCVEGFDRWHVHDGYCRTVRPQ